MKTRILCLFLLAAVAPACAAPKSQRVPTLTGPAADAPKAEAPPKRDFVQEVGQTTWNVVTAPARLVMPKKEPAKEPETYETPTAVITRRNYGEEDIPAGPLASPPATRP